MCIIPDKKIELSHLIKKITSDIYNIYEPIKYNVLFALISKDIDKKEYPNEFINTIIDAIRCSLISLYKDQQTELNSIIGLGPVSTLDGFNIKKEIKDQRS